MIEKLLGAACMGGAIGFERELRGKPAGIKTNALVALAASSIIVLTQALNIAELPRAIAGVVQGVGFIGGGLILKEGRAAKGLTSAAAIWVSAAIGLACGTAQWTLAFSSLLTALLILRGVKLFQRK